AIVWFNVAKDIRGVKRGRPSSKTGTGNPRSGRTLKEVEMSETLTAVPPLNLEPRPFVCNPIAIEPAWIDYNGHLNMAYYNVLFDRSLDQFMDMLGVGWRYLK